MESQYLVTTTTKLIRRLIMASLQKTIVVGPRTELHETLGLTGCEASYNVLPAGAAIPFVHAHKHTAASRPGPRV